MECRWHRCSAPPGSSVKLPAAWTIVKIVAITIPLILAVAYLTLAERKVIGWMQVRIGPNRVGPLGLLQPFADVFKLVFKEIVLPTGASRHLFFAAPILAIAPALAAWAVVPFTDGGVLADINAGLLYVLAMTSIGVYGIILAGWASNSKYAFLGCLRSAAQIVSYEIAMGFALVGVLMAANTLNLSGIVRGQEGGLAYWYFIPLFPLFIVYLVSGVAETNRHPFDVAEGESEIVAGFHVEYSGVAFAVFFLAEYMNMILISALASVMFLGGWLSLWPGLNQQTLPAWLPIVGGTAPLGDGMLWLFSKMCRHPVLLPVDPGDLPTLSLRPDHAARMESVHSGDARVDRVSRRDDADALGRPVPLTATRCSDVAREFPEYLAAGRALARPHAHGPAYVRPQDHGPVPGREDAAEPAFPRPACAASLPQWRGALHRVQAVRGGVSGARDHDRVRGARGRHAADDPL